MLISIGDYIHLILLLKLLERAFRNEGFFLTLYIEVTGLEPAIKYQY